MSDSQFVNLGQLLSGVKGGGTPEREFADYWNGPIPWATVKDFRDGLHVLDRTQEYISEHGLKNSASKLIPPHTPIVCTRMAVGRVAMAGFSVAINQDLKALFPKSGVDPDYLLRAIGSVRPAIEATAIGSTVKGISLDQLLSIKVFFPNSEEEQKKIAEVLSTLDRAIEQTEALIAKQQRIKTGLMQDLLTFGLDEHGNIRSEATHSFKDSPLGRIPVEWVCAQLSYFVPSAEYGISTSLGDSGIPVLRMNNFVDGEADISDLKFSDLEVPEHLLLKEGDVLFNRTNSWEHVGRTGIWRSQLEKATFASYLVRLNPHPDLLTPELLNIWLNWAPTQIAMRRQATPAVQQVNINPTNLRSIHAAFPDSLEEQNEIVKCLSSMRVAIDATQETLQKLRQLKAGLMHDLLTGNHRVTPLLAQAAPQ